MNAGPSASTSASARPELDVVGSAGIFGNFFPQTFPHPKKNGTIFSFHNTHSDAFSFLLLLLLMLLSSSSSLLLLRPIKKSVLVSRSSHPVSTFRTFLPKAKKNQTHTRGVTAAIKNRNQTHTTKQNRNITTPKTKMEQPPPSR